MFQAWWWRMAAGLVLAATIVAAPAGAQGPIGRGSFGFKIYETNYIFYPFVQVYMRTFNDQGDPLVNLNYANIALMVKGRLYDPQKVDVRTRTAQYNIETLENRQESFRTVFVWDRSLSMKGQPFTDAANAILKFIEAKRPGDQVAVICTLDESPGYEIVSNFEKDPTLLYQRIQDVKCTGQLTRLYDAVGAAIKACGAASQGATTYVGAEYAILSTIVVVSDGKDEGSAVTREEVLNNLRVLPRPVPIYTLSYSRINPEYAKNLEALSQQTFGKHWTVGESREFGRVIQDIHRINRNDYVLTFRAYIDIDGNSHKYKVGIEYPTNSGQVMYDEGAFEAVQTPAAAIPRGEEYFAALNAMFPYRPEGPYAETPGGQVPIAPGPIAPQAPAPPAGGASVSGPGAAPNPFNVADAEPAPPAPDVALPAPKDEAQPDKAKAAPAAAASGGDSGGGGSGASGRVALAGMGAGLLIVAIAVILWVKRGSGAPAAQRDAGTTPNPRREAARRTTPQTPTLGVAQSASRRSGVDVGDQPTMPAHSDN